MKLLTELIEEGVELITEATTGSLYIQGPMLLQEELNRNRRRYSKKVMKPAVETYINEYVNRNRAVGELGHPASPTVNLDRAAILVTELHEDGNYYNGKAKVLTETPMGKITAALLKEDVSLGVSSRATAEVKKEKDFTDVTGNLRFHAIDVVGDPSAHKAFVSSVMENVDWVYDAAKDSWAAQKIVEEVRETGKRDAQFEAKAALLFERFLHSIGDNYKDHPDNVFLTKSDRKMLNEMAGDDQRERSREVFVRARKHLAGVATDKEALNELLAAHGLGSHRTF